MSTRTDRSARQTEKPLRPFNRPDSLDRLGRSTGNYFYRPDSLDRLGRSTGNYFNRPTETDRPAGHHMKLASQDNS
jgi:hypothetical protein